MMDAQSQSEHPIGKGISRRTLAQVLAAGAVAATAGTPAFAQQTSSMSEASPQDYVRDPTRWGSPEVAALFPGFKHLDMRTKGAVIRVRHGGSGPPLLLLHGYPNNHVLWHAVAAKLAQRYHVVCPDLRAYGDSSLPDPGARLINYSHRVMAEDMIEVMEQLGHQRFFLIGHDRGARVSHRMCLDHPERVMKLCLLDMLPTYYVWTNTTREWALGTWHWAFLAQPEPFPQTMINAVGPEWFLTSRGGNPRQRPKISRWTRPTKIKRSRLRCSFCGVQEAYRRRTNIQRSGGNSRASWRPSRRLPRDTTYKRKCPSSVSIVSSNSSQPSVVSLN